MQQEFDTDDRYVDAEVTQLILHNMGYAAENKDNTNSCMTCLLAQEDIYFNYVCFANPGFSFRTDPNSTCKSHRKTKPGPA